MVYNTNSTVLTFYVRNNYIIVFKISPFSNVEMAQTHFTHTTANNNATIAAIRMLYDDGAQKLTDPLELKSKTANLVSQKTGFKSNGLFSQCLLKITSL